MLNETLWNFAPKGVLTTGIGSLPHACVDSALQFSFALNVPFLPQIPIRNPSEYMVGQAIDLLPGASFPDGGNSLLEFREWEQGSEALRRQTENAFRTAGKELNAFEDFEPSPEVWSAWVPFIWELQERKIQFAKIQIAGPMTCQWVLRYSEDTPGDRMTEIGTQIFHLVLARAMAMCRKLSEFGIIPLLYLDEPGFYGFSSANAKHWMALQELKLFIQTLKKEKVLVGIHCCSNTEWKSILSLPIDVLSIDTNLSLSPLLEEKEAVKSFLESGKRFSFGIVPTGTHTVKIRSHRPELLFDRLLEVLHKAFSNEPLVIREMLQHALFTPACGLALHSIEDSEAILSNLLEVSEICERYLKTISV